MRLSARENIRKRSYSSYKYIYIFFKISFLWTVLDCNVCNLYKLTIDYYLLFKESSANA